MTAIGFAEPLRAQGGGPPGGPGGGGFYTVSVSPGTISLATPGTPEFNRGYTAHSGIDLVVDRDGPGRGGPGWVLEVRADEATLGGPGKPVSDLLVRDPDGGWIPLSTSFQTLARGRGPSTVTTNLRMRLAYGRDVPDLYGTALTFRVSRR